MSATSPQHERVETRHACPAGALAERARRAVEQLQSAGFTAYWAGGCVRDMLLGQVPSDYDIATDAHPERVIELFPSSITVGKAFAVVRAPLDGEYFEIATFRRDHGYRDGRRPDAVSFTDAQTDARRRDFTINAMFYDPVAEIVLDYVNGRADIEQRCIRCVGNPAERLGEDHLRLLRAVRFAATLQFELEPHTETAIRENAAGITRISGERVRDELCRTLLEAERPGQAILLLDRVGLLEHILPEIAAMKGQEQPAQFHPEGDVFTHTVMLLDLIEKPDRHLALSALLHDVGKPPTAAEVDGRIRFNRHANVGADMAAAILRRLRFSNDDVETVTHCVRNHMRFVDAPKMKRSTLRKFVGDPHFPLELELHRLDCLASHGSLDTHAFLLSFLEELAAEPVLPPAWISGRDVLALGVPEGRQIGTWLERAYEAQLDERFASREELLDWLREEIRGQGPTQS